MLKARSDLPKGSASISGFPKVGDPSIVAEIVGSLYYKDPNIRYP